MKFSQKRKGLEKSDTMSHIHQISHSILSRYSQLKSREQVLYFTFSKNLFLKRLF